ncbi:hypothetical protein [Streptosporangium sp. V21-05]|uniref:hypothetical protein n=1 Tax=Streptosporangium sp. V21-05 TaxID=3446115 RepID=UPI003F53099A
MSIRTLLSRFGAIRPGTPTVAAVEYRVGPPPGTIDTAYPAYVRVRVSEFSGKWSVTCGTTSYDRDARPAEPFVWRDGQEPFTDYDKNARTSAHVAWIDRHEYDLETALAIARTVAMREVTG